MTTFIIRFIGFPGLIHAEDLLPHPSHLFEGAVVLLQKLQDLPLP
jgi:hypothetical protein